jgi:hypothetical protein
MLGRAKERGLNPDCTLFDSWYSSIDNLKLVRSLGWHWFTGLKSNRLVDPDRSGNRAISEVEVPEEGRVSPPEGVRDGQSIQDALQAWGR